METEAKERQREGGGGKVSEDARALPAKRPEALETGDSREFAAQKVGVSARSTTLKRGAESPVVATVQQRENPEENARSVQKAASATGVGARSVSKAKHVVEDGIESLKEAVRDGKIDVTLAEKVSKLPAEEQEAVASAMVSEKTAAAKVGCFTMQLATKTGCHDTCKGVFLYTCTHFRERAEGALYAYIQAYNRLFGRVIKRVNLSYDSAALTD